MRRSNHPVFNVISIVVLLITIGVGISYNYLTSVYPLNLVYRFALKPIPVSMMILNIFAYFIIYRMHFYALLIGVSLIFCLLGDILLMFYLPGMDKYDNELFLIIGGVSFFIARGFMCLGFAVYPFRGKSERCIQAGIKKTVIITILCFIYTVAIITYFVVHMDSGVIRILLPMYFVMMGVNLEFSILRVGGFLEEIRGSQVKGALGTIIFTISDTLLFWGIFLNPIPNGDAISICLYWLAMFLLTISVVRTKNIVTERLGGPNHWSQQRETNIY